MTALILVADASKARLFSAADKYHELTEVADFIHPAVAADNPGARTVAGRSGTRHGMEPQTLPKEHDMKAFAMELAKYIGQEFVAQKYSELTLVAPPEFLGALRNALHQDVKKVINQAINKNLTHYSSNELAKLLQEQNSLH